jgi:hypothetical protein
MLGDSCRIQSDFSGFHRTFSTAASEAGTMSTSSPPCADASSLPDRSRSFPWKDLVMRFVASSKALIRTADFVSQ